MRNGGKSQSGEEGEVPMQSAVVGVDEVVGDETMTLTLMLATTSWLTEMYMATKNQWQSGVAMLDA
jgi:hypothetical protein